MIFNWFKEDWTSGYRGLDGTGTPIRSREQFFARFATSLADDPQHQKLIQEQRAAVRYLDYDWGLNDVRK